MNKTERIKQLNRDIEENKQSTLNYERQRQACIALLDTLPNDLDLPSVSGYCLGEQIVIDFDNPTHAQRITLMEALQLGQWTKSINEGDTSMIYSAQWNGHTVRLYGAPLLPCCKVIETIEHVPASIRKVRRVECPEPLTDFMPASLPEPETTI